MSMQSAHTNYIFQLKVYLGVRKALWDAHSAPPLLSSTALIRESSSIIMLFGASTTLPCWKPLHKKKAYLVKIFAVAVWVLPYDITGILKNVSTHLLFF